MVGTIQITKNFLDRHWYLEKTIYEAIMSLRPLNFFSHLRFFSSKPPYFYSSDAKVLKQGSECVALKLPILKQWRYSVAFKLSNLKRWRNCVALKSLWTDCIASKPHILQLSRAQHSSARVQCSSVGSALPLQRQKEFYRLHQYRYRGIKFFIGFIATIIEAYKTYIGYFITITMLSFCYCSST